MEYNGTLPTRLTTGRRIALVAAPLLLALATAVPASSTWKPLPRFGGPVLALAAAEGAPLLYAGTETAGPVRSNNAGETWLQTQAPETVRIVKLEVDPRDPRVVFAAARTLTDEGAGVLRSLDGGAHWQPVNDGLGGDSPLRVSDLEHDPSDEQKLYAATEDGLYQTRDRGASWQLVGLDEYFVFGVAVHPLRPGTLFASTYHNRTQEVDILKSVDGGATWTSSSQGIEGNPVFADLIFHPTAPETLFAFGNGWPLHVSRDGGATWTNLGQPLVSLTFGLAGTLFGAPYDENGVLKSIDGGLHWTQAGALDDRIRQVLAANGRLYAAGRLGVWISTDNGAHWRPSSRGLSARNVGDLTESGSVLYATFTEGALASRTDGTSWRELESDEPDARIVRFLTAGPNAIYALQVQGEFERSTFVRSRDGGTTWTELASPGLGGIFSSFAADPRRPAVLYAGSEEQSGNDRPFCHLARSTNGGRSWTCLAGEASVYAIQVEPKTSTPYVIAAGNMFVLAGGTAFELRGTGLPANGTRAFAFDPQRAGTLYAATTEGVFKTTNGGRSWTRASRGLPAGEAYSVAVDPQRSGVVYAGFQGRVFRSLDAGRTWKPFGNGLPADALIVELLPSVSDPERLYAVAAGHGLYWQER